MATAEFCNILLSNLRKKSVFLVLLYFSDYHSLCEILPGSIFLHQCCSWCQWRIARLEQLVGVSRLWGAISVHLLRAIQLLEYQMVRALCRFDTLGNLVSAHQGHVRTTVLWCVTGARCVSGATIAADFTHQVPVIMIQMGGAWVAPGVPVSGTWSMESAALVAPLTHRAPVTQRRTVARTCHWCSIPRRY